MLSVQWLASRQRCCSSISCDSNPHSLGRRARSVIPVTSCVTSVTLRSFSKPLCHRDFSVAFVVIFSLSLLGMVSGFGYFVKLDPNIEIFGTLRSERRPNNEISWKRQRCTPHATFYKTSAMAIYERINMKNFYENAPPSEICGKDTRRTHQRRWGMEPP